MSKPLTLIIPSRTEDYLRVLFNSLNRHQSGWQNNPEWKVIVMNSGNAIDAGYTRFLESMGISVVGLPDPFVFSRAVNTGVKVSRRDSNIIVMNDDASFVSPRPFHTAQELFDRMEAQGYGLVGALVSKGTVGNLDQQRGDLQKGVFFESKGTICFVTVLIPRSAFDVVGQMDEQFTGYGYEDNDYSYRTVRAKLKLGVTNEIVVEHGLGGHQFSSTFMEQNDPVGMANLSKKNKNLFVQKWGSAAPEMYERLQQEVEAQEEKA